MTKLNIKTVLILTLLIILFISPKISHANEFKPDPFFEKIERVYIYLDYNTIDISNDEILDILKKKSLEKRVFEVYRERFSSKDCHKYIKVVHPYNCNDQPVYIVKKEDKARYLRGDRISIATSEELRSKGTLHVLTSVWIIGNKNSTLTSTLNSPLILISTNRELMGYDFHLRYSAPISITFPINQTIEKIEEKLNGVWKYSVY